MKCIINRYQCELKKTLQGNFILMVMLSDKEKYAMRLMYKSVEKNVVVKVASFIMLEANEVIEKMDELNSQKLLEAVK